MPKTEPVPCTKEEMDAILNASMEDDFFFMLFKVARKTGRRLGEYYGSLNKKTKQWEGGVKVNDIDLSLRKFKAGVRIGFLNEVHAYVIPREGEDTVGLAAYQDADRKDYSVHN